MDRLTRLASRAVAIMNANIDTDIITPMQRITGRDAARSLGRYAFEPLRYLGGNADTGEPDPAFPLNDPACAGARIMICGENFGCGSSRESAPVAIAALGIRCLVGSSFGDIFFNNCFQQGILPIVLPVDTVNALADEAARGGQFQLKLADQTLTAPSGRVVEFDVNELRKRKLAEGLDDLELILEHAADIEAFEARDRADRPWVYPPVRSS